jgi:hypothetical protein
MSLHSRVGVQFQWKAWATRASQRILYQPCEGSPLLISISSSPSFAYKSWRKGTDHKETLLNEAEVTTPFWWIVVVATMADVDPGVDGLQ